MNTKNTYTHVIIVILILVVPILEARKFWTSFSALIGIVKAPICVLSIIKIGMTAAAFGERKVVFSTSGLDPNGIVEINALAVEMENSGINLMRIDYKK